MSFSRVVLPQPLGPSATIVGRRAPAGASHGSRPSTSARHPKSRKTRSASCRRRANRSVPWALPRPVRLGVQQRSMAYYRRQSPAVARTNVRLAFGSKRGRAPATCAAEIRNHPSPLRVTSIARCDGARPVDSAIPCWRPRSRGGAICREGPPSRPFPTAGKINQLPATPSIEWARWDGALRPAPR